MNIATKKRLNGKIKENKKISRFRCGHGRIDYEEIIRDKNIQDKLKNYNNLLKYEGEYLNGKRNGKGKEYNINGKLIFEGKYLDGNIKKKKDEYNDYTEDNFKDISFSLVLEGNLKNGLKDGLIKKFYLGQLTFEGEYLNGVRNGKGKEYDKNNGNLLFEGEYFNGKKWNGIYKEYYNYENLIKFEGEYLSGNKKGKEYNIKRTINF